MLTAPQTVKTNNGVMLISGGGVVARVALNQHEHLADCLFVDTSFRNNRTFFTLTKEGAEILADHLLDWVESLDDGDNVEGSGSGEDVGEEGKGCVVLFVDW